MKFEDRSQEETERQQRCARSKAWNLAKHIYKLREKDKITFYSPSERWVLPVASTKERKERDFAVDPGARVHMVSKKDRNSAELETMRPSKSPMTVMTANGEVRTTEEATVYVKQLDLFVKVMLPAVLSLGNSVRIMGKHTTGSGCQKPHLTKKGQENLLQCIKLCTICGSWNHSEFFLYYAFICLVIIFFTGFRIWCQQIQ